jgi:organic hydroperoxide reductase OsmC/OhrA
MLKIFIASIRRALMGTPMTQPGKVLYTAKTHTTGARKNGADPSADVQLEIRLSPPGSDRPGTNPERFFATGWSGGLEGAIGYAARLKKIALPSSLLSAAALVAATGLAYAKDTAPGAQQVVAVQSQHPSEIAAPSMENANAGASTGTAISAQDKYTLQVPNGLAFSEFKGYEDWQTVAVSQTGDKIEVILGNPAMINAYKTGIPGNGKPFPDGVKMAKIHWKAKKSALAPASTTVPDTLHDVDFMVKDNKRFADGGGWGYAEFEYAAASDTFRPGTLEDKPPQGNDAKCGVACHTIAKKQDYVFTEYPKR